MSEIITCPKCKNFFIVPDFSEKYTCPAQGSAGVVCGHVFTSRQAINNSGTKPRAEEIHPERPARNVYK
jgi:hypothetical protein